MVCLVQVSDNEPRKNNSEVIFFVYLFIGMTNRFVFAVVIRLNMTLYNKQL